MAATMLGCCALAACGGGDDPREQVDDYLREANGVQARWADSFTSAEEAYVAFSRSELEGEQAVQRLAGAQDDIRAARAALGDVEPPEPARGLHDRYLRYLDLNVDLAGETVVLARYVPAAEAALAPLPRVNRRLQRELRRARDASDQARALGRFDDRLARIGGTLEELRVPPVLQVTHGDQLRALARTRGYAGRLRRALRTGDAEAVARLLRRFRLQPDAGRERLARRAIERYTRRYQGLQDAYIELRREEARVVKAVT